MTGSTRWRSPGIGAVLPALALSLGSAPNGAAQNPLPAPVIEQPVFNSTTPGLDAAQPTNLRLKLRKVANVTKYQVVAEDLTGVVFFNQILSLGQGMQDPQTVLYNIPIPPGKQGTTNRVRVRSCHPNDQCSTAARVEQFIVLPSPPAIGGPPHPSTVPPNRVVTFTWPHLLTGVGDYQLTILTGAPEDVGWNGFNPAAVNPPNQSIRVRPSATPFTHTLPPGPTAFIWGMARCLDFPGKGRRCGPTTPFRSLTVSAVPAVSFTATLAPTFQHARCTTCHAVATSGLTTVVPTTQHQGVAIGNTANCTGCHNNTLLPNQGFNPGWHEAPASMDLRNKTPAQLCAMAQNPASAGTVLNHLTQDRLILWAVGDGRVPGNGVRTLAPPGSIATWQSRVQAWVDAGMPCP